jgi:hypothetical protein
MFLLFNFCLGHSLIPCPVIGMGLSRQFELAFSMFGAFRNLGTYMYTVHELSQLFASFMWRVYLCGEWKVERELSKTGASEMSFRGSPH